MSAQVRVGAPKLWEPKEGAKRTPNPYRVVTAVGGGRKNRKTKSFPTKSAALAYLSRLTTARNNGEPFDVETGEPFSWAVATGNTGSGATIAELALARVISKWPELRAKSRESLVAGVAQFVAAFAPERVTRRDAYRVTKKVLVARSTDGLEAGDLNTWRRIAQTSPTAISFTPERVAAALAIISTNLDGSIAVKSTIDQRRSALTQVLDEGGVKAVFPRAARGTRTRSTTQVSPSVIGTAAEVETVVDQAFCDGSKLAYQIMLYAGLRPGETSGLTWEFVDLDRNIIIVAENTPDGSKEYTDSGDSYDVQPPKWRSDGESRNVPIIPRLAILLAAAKRDSGFVCRNRAGNRLTVNQLGKTWSKARDKAAPNWPTTKLKKPYDLRHTHASICLSAGVPTRELADRLGHAPSQLLEIYAAAVPADAPRWTAVMDEALATSSQPSTIRTVSPTVVPANTLGSDDF